MEGDTSWCIHIITWKEFDEDPISSTIKRIDSIHEMNCVYRDWSICHPTSQGGGYTRGVALSTPTSHVIMNIKLNWELPCPFRNYI